MERARVVAGALGLAYAVAACSLVTSLDGFSNGPPPTGSDANGVDAPSESAPLSDAQPEAEARDAGGTFCSGQTPKPTFCADFDEGELPQPFSKTVIEGKGTLVLDATKSVSAPRAMLSTIAPSASSGAAVAVVLPSASEMTIDFDIAIEQSGTVGYDILTIEAAGGYEIGLEANGNDISFEDERPLPDGASNQSNKPTGARLEPTFKHVTFHMRRDGTDCVVNVTVGTIKTEFRTLAPILETPEMYIGDDSHVQEQGTWRVRYDNVVVRTVPK